jgi:hypothetical protein
MWGLMLIQVLVLSVLVGPYNAEVMNSTTVKIHAPIVFHETKVAADVHVDIQTAE